VTIVRDLDGEDMRSSRSKTDRGEFVLDNLSSEIRPWNADRLPFVKRQFAGRSRSCARDRRFPAQRPVHDRRSA